MFSAKGFEEASSHGEAREQTMVRNMGSQIAELVTLRTHKISSLDFVKNLGVSLAKSKPKSAKID